MLGWFWLDQALAADAAGAAGTVDADLVAGKRHGCRFFFESELPRVTQLLDFVASGSDVASAAPVCIF